MILSIRYQKLSKLSIDKMQFREKYLRSVKGIGNVVNYCLKILHVVYLYFIILSSSLIYFKYYLLKMQIIL